MLQWLAKHLYTPKSTVLKIYSSNAACSNQNIDWVIKLKVINLNIFLLCIKLIARPGNAISETIIRNRGFNDFVLMFCINK